MDQVWASQEKLRSLVDSLGAGIASRQENQGAGDLAVNSLAKVVTELKMTLAAQKTENEMALGALTTNVSELKASIAEVREALATQKTQNDQALTAFASDVNSAKTDVAAVRETLATQKMEKDTDLRTVTTEISSVKSSVAAINNTVKMQEAVNDQALKGIISSVEDYISAEIKAQKADNEQAWTELATKIASAEAEVSQMRVTLSTQQTAEVQAFEELEEQIGKVALFRIAEETEEDLSYSVETPTQASPGLVDQGEDGEEYDNDFHSYRSPMVYRSPMIFRSPTKFRSPMKASRCQKAQC